MATKKDKDTEITVLSLETGRFTACLLGTTPLILNRMSEKAKRELLLPRGRRNAAERASTLKHDPIAEFKASAYRSRNDGDPTYLLHLASAFKGALRGAALDMPGAAKSQIGRLTWVEGERIPIFGIPKLHMSIVRSAGMNKTPDVRTRCIVPEWACYVDVSYARPLLTQETVVKLLAGAGITQGTGDWRPEKGSGTYGQFVIVSPDDAKFKRIVDDAGRNQQIAAFENPVPYDEDTEELLLWFDEETRRRGLHVLGEADEDEIEDEEVADAAE